MVFHAGPVITGAITSLVINEKVARLRFPDAQLQAEADDGPATAFNDLLAYSSNKKRHPFLWIMPVH